MERSKSLSCLSGFKHVFHNYYVAEWSNKTWNWKTTNKITNQPSETQLMRSLTKTQKYFWTYFTQHSSTL